MRTLRAYVDLDSIDFAKNYQLPVDTAHHLTRVLRVSVSHPLEVFDGKGRVFDAEIASVGKQVSIRLLAEKNLPPTESPCKIQLMLSVGKGEKMDWIIQKATELGVSIISPLISARCEVRLDAERWKKKIERWREIAINACEQSGRNTLPVIHDIVSLSTGLQAAKFRLKLALHPGEGCQSFKSMLGDEPSKEVTLLIGPEGGLDDKEIQLAQERSFLLTSLGPRILRMETAAIAGVTILQALLGDLCSQN